MTELETMRARAAWAEAELRKIHRENAQAAIDRRDELQREEDQRRATERADAERVALEEQRAHAWFNSRVEAAVAGGDEAFSRFLSGDLERHRRDLPPGWPEGMSPEVRQHLDLTPEPESERDISGTTLGQLLVLEGVRQRRVTLPAKNR
jgi:hypothetical protein